MCACPLRRRRSLPCACALLRLAAVCRVRVCPSHRRVLLCALPAVCACTPRPPRVLPCARVPLPSSSFAVCAFVLSPSPLEFCPLCASSPQFAVCECALCALARVLPCALCPLRPHRVLPCARVPSALLEFCRVHVYSRPPRVLPCARVPRPPRVLPCAPVLSPSSSFAVCACTLALLEFCRVRL